jgi:uncharacterized membrane protein
MLENKASQCRHILGGIIIGGVAPFLAVMAFGSVFDSRGGEPFSATMGMFLVLSPLWLIIGVAAAVACCRSLKARRVIRNADITLLVVIVFAPFLIRLIFG